MSSEPVAPSRWQTVCRRTRTVVAAGLVAWAACPYVSSWAWLIDLAGNLAVQAALACVIGAAWWALWRRWRCAAAAGAGLLLALGAIVPGRAAWEAGVDPADPRRITVLTYNAKIWLDKLDPGRREILSSNADVVGLLGALPELYKEPGTLTQALAVRYPYHAEMELNAPWFGYWVLSKWPTEPFVLTDEEREGLHPMACVVLRPGGRFGLLVMRPASPRSTTRWIKGNAETEIAGAVARRMREAGLEVVLLADFNGTPSGHRAGLLVEAGLRRCMPATRLVGTYPSASFWPFTVAIDDAAVSDGIRTLNWGVLGSGGSDHHAVRTELLVPLNSGPE
ncbi:MAG: endonuclease/exonuclease/phosphatase family protein [Phycisphaeraceae bacterium]|nr:endonuclease/exonuclease/phosphatase family protein [Phycisphaeraceae bacterium]